MFQPRGPYLRRSKINAWKNDRPMNIFFHSLGFLHYSNLTLSWVPKDLSKLFFRPRGGSYVILIPFMRIVTGKMFEGILVSHSLKFGLAVSLSMPSWMRYRSGINDGARWQFCRRTHFPSAIAFLIVFSAIYPWPCPREIAVKLDLKPLSSARLVISIRGSAPGDRMKINGVILSESL